MPAAPADSVQRFLDGIVIHLTGALLELAQARANGRGEAELAGVAAALQEVLIGANILGRSRTMDDAARASRGGTFARTAPPDVIPGFVPRVPFREALKDLLRRKPILERDYRELARRYSIEKVFGLARSTDLVLTEKVRDLLNRAWSVSRSSTAAVQKAIADMGDWTRAYAETVFRTNAATSFSEGRLEKAVELRAVLPVVRFTAVLDDDTRPNHRLADGVLAAPDDPIWRILRPPLGYRCRCRFDHVSWEEAVQAGVIDAKGNVRPGKIPRGAGPDPGFRIAA